MALNEKQIINILNLVNDSDYGYLNLAVDGVELTLIKRDMDVRLLKENFMIDDRSNLKYAANSVAETKEISEQEKQSERKQIINKAEDKQKNESLSQNNYTEDHIIVKAPMLGTFFRKPSPDEPVYAEVGDVVEAADTVCLIEVMKLFNSISAGKKGRIADILVSDGEMVEYDQPLFVLEPI